VEGSHGYGPLGAGMVHVGHEFERYEENDDHVTVYFRDRPDPVRAKLLVGCDGFFSPVRRECLRDGPPTFGVRLYCILVPACGPFARLFQWGYYVQGMSGVG
jgi:2-polyprenyl-6-methoxyphenol hydroxylase-like FAD-dependent oxidoreductase